ncbi:hypothetical protein ACP70R_008557 [Stipagrostis hirtigluma subsp. patula]
MDAQGALDSLLGRLTTVLVSEAQLLGGVRADVEFIKDEMESMNGLLLHLTDAQHRDHQVRAWMKQIVGLARDSGGNVELYLQYVGGAPGGGGLLGYLRRIPRFVRTIRVRHQIATRIQELKVRARDVGDRRLRYGVTVPPAEPYRYRAVDDRPAPQLGSPEEDEELQRRELLHLDLVEECAKQVLEWLSDEAKDADEWPRVIGIEKRMGPVEPTDIARRVYGHSSVVRSVPLRVWIDFGGVDRGIDEVCKEMLEQIQLSITTKEEVLEAQDGLSLLDKVTEQLSAVKLLINSLAVLSDLSAGSGLIATQEDWIYGKTIYKTLERF